MSIAAVNSSVAFGFNLFMPFREHGASALEEPLARALGFAIRVVDIEFEFQGPTDVLAECAGPQPTDDEKFTASDVAVHVEDDDGRAGVVLVEVKLSEGGFTPCNGARSAANKRKDNIEAATPGLIIDIPDVYAEGMLFAGTKLYEEGHRNEAPWEDGEAGVWHLHQPDARERAGVVESDIVADIR